MERINELIKLLNYYTEKYDEGNPLITDQEWDNLYFELQTLEKEYNYYAPNSPTQSVHFVTKELLAPVLHTHAMLSLDKTKDWETFLRYFGNKDCTGMVKLDGLTCSLEYKNGQLVRAETRGDGTTGEDIFHNALVIPSILKSISYTDHLIIDGEIICTEKDFAQFASQYANQRNFASGSIRLLDSAECAKRHLTFVAWNIVEGFDNTNSFLDKLIKLEEYGFYVVPWTSSFDWDAREFLVDRAKKLGYPIDGLVGRFDNISYGQSLGATAHHSRAAFAFKFYDEVYDSHLTDIEWSLGRTGQINPVAIFEPIQFEDAIVERASLHNKSILTDIVGNKPYVGQWIKVSKRNMIIPQVEWADTQPKKDVQFIEFPIVCPCCGSPITEKISDTGVINLWCDNARCPEKVINRLDFFCGKEGLDIKGLSCATLEKLIELGWINSIVDIFNLKNHRSEWINQPGFGTRSVDNILRAIESKTNCSLDSFISALGISLLGNRYSKELCKHISSWEDFRMKVKNKFDFTTIDGFGPEIQKSILSFDYCDADVVADILKPTNDLKATPSIGLTVVITGKLTHSKNRDELKKKIEDIGGKVTDSVTKNTTLLINNDITSNSSKNKTAKALNIPIITEDSFYQQYLK